MAGLDSAYDDLLEITITEEFDYEPYKYFRGTVAPMILATQIMDMQDVAKKESGN